MAEIKLHLEGESAEAAAEELVAFFQREFGEKPQRLGTGGADETGQKLDPVAVAALILAIPGAVLTAMDLAERIRLREKVAKLIEFTKRIKAEKGTVPRIETPRGLRDLSSMEADEVLDATGRGAAGDRG